MPMNIERRYWDSDACIAFLQAESGKVDSCRAVMEAAEEGRVEIVISALTIAEVVTMRGRERIPEEQAETVRRFFKRDFFLVVDVDRYIAEQAQELCWGFGIHPKDAIHVATALSLGVPYLDTFDKRLIAKSGKVGGKPPLIICTPGVGMAIQATMSL